ncbi:MAG: pyruvate kinase [Myxococcales bacterium]|nr:pyruvate kinase [Myxococcales bacterium]
MSFDLSRVALKHRRTRIVATVGPASASEAVLRRLVDAGVNVFRLNFSHGDHDSHGALYSRIRAITAGVASPVAILADLCGPKIRVGYFPDGAIALTPGTTITITTRAVPGAPGLIPSEYEPLARDVKPGDRILLADGAMTLEVSGTDGVSEIEALVIHGGKLSDRKGMNLPGVALSTPSLTDKDRRDARFAAALGVDYLALSFVRSAQDMTDLRTLLEACCGPDDVQPHLIAKIEKPEALRDIDGILAASDAIMVARGDLGVELPPEEVPIIQQELVAAAVLANRPVIVATQMLESMIEAPRPTRAEVSDIAWAAASGADAVMLSGETAAGRYPVESVETMDRVLRLVEGWQWRHGQFGGLERLRDDTARPVDRALSRATASLSRDLRVRAVVVLTGTGRTARAVSAHRPAAPIVPLCTDQHVWRSLALFWGCSPRLVSTEDLDNQPALALRVVEKMQLAPPGSHVLMVWDTAYGERHWAPTVTVLEVPGTPVPQPDDVIDLG